METINTHCNSEQTHRFARRVDKSTNESIFAYGLSRLTSNTICNRATTPTARTHAPPTHGAHLVALFHDFGIVFAANHTGRDAKDHRLQQPVAKDFHTRNLTTATTATRNQDCASACVYACADVSTASPAVVAVG